MKRRNLILLLGGASSGAMTIGTGAFSSAQVERGVSVSVTNDEDAFIRYETPNDGAGIDQGGERITLVRVRNQFGGNQEIGLVGVEYEADDEVLKDVTVERKKTGADPGDVGDFDDEDFEDVDEEHVGIKPGSADSFPEVNEDDAFGPGEWVRIVADAHVSPGETVEIEVTITVKGIEGTGVSARLFGDTRQFTLTGRGIEDVVFDGNGNAETVPDVGTVDVEARFGGTGEGSDPNTVTDLSWDTSNKIDDAISGSDNSGKLLAVRFTATGRIFVNPSVELDDDRLPNEWKDGELESGTDRGSYQSGSSGGSPPDN